MESLPLVDAMAARGYRTVGMTANIYFSRGQGFATGFDEFYETRRPLNPRGLNPFSAVRSREPPEGAKPRTYLQVLGDVFRHERPLASLANYGRAVGIELDRRYEYRDWIPGINTDDYGFLTNGSNRSESLLLDLFQSQAGQERPFFAFTNFMDTHYPYEPAQEYLDNVSDGAYDVADVRELDPDIAQSWVFLNEHYGNSVDEDDLELVRTAYRGEVRSVDNRVARLLEELEREGIRDETLVVITADHGEALGEMDVRGERSIGHLDSLNKYLRTVPLILVHPHLNPETVKCPVPLHRLTTLLVQDGTTWINADGPVEETFVTNEPVLFELPANPFHESFYDDYEHIPDWYANREARTHTVAGVAESWLVAAGSDGTVTAWFEGEERDVANAPSDLVSAATDALEMFPADETTDEGSVSGDLQQQLEDLGYM